MWTTVYVATGQEWAEEVECKLKAEGFIVKRKYFATEGDEELYEILAPTFEAEEIQSVLVELDIL
ncbi:MAG: hypothetical protein GX185_01860 [Tissierellia bacterium]|nr:hypothetical protein [Tissierellia bacterium]